MYELPTNHKTAWKRRLQTKKQERWSLRRFGNATSAERVSGIDVNSTTSTKLALNALPAGSVCQQAEMSSFSVLTATVPTTRTTALSASQSTAQRSQVFGQWTN